MITLYSTGCPQCSVLKIKLDNAGIKYNISDNIDAVIEKGFMSMPVLDVDGEFMDFMTAIKWIRNKEMN